MVRVCPASCRLCRGRPEPERIFVPSLMREAVADTPVKAWARALALTAPIARNPGRTLPTVIGELAESHGHKPALIGDDEVLTFQQLSARVNQFARWGLEHGVKKGDVICLVMQNCPTYLSAWLGMTRIGAIVSLVNTNLVGDSLAHVIRVAAPKLLIVDAPLDG